MADITDPTAIGFIDEKIRPLADMLARVFYTGKVIIDEYNTRGGSSFIPNDPLAIIKDGAELDSRPVLSGADVVKLGLVMSTLIADWEANANAKLKNIMTVANRPIIPPGVDVPV